MPSEHAPNTEGRRFGRNFSLLHPKASREHLSELRWKSKSNQAVVELKQDGRKKEKTPAQVEKRQSRMSLFDLFSKPKVERARGFHESGLEALSERSQTPAHFYRIPDSSQEKSQPSHGQKEAPKSIVRPTADWDPPPLFQAYPQAIKHATLHTISISTETLIRVQQYRTQGLDIFGSTTSLPYVSEEGGEHAGARLPSKRFSTIADNLEIVEKVFVLVTEGRIVQYAAKGSSDRAPEKVLQLGEKSAAFACDLIPGKHWVLQIVQAANEDGAPTIKQSRSLLSKLRMPSSASRRNTSSFLMILDSAEEMDAWLKAIRKMIEHLGGKRTNPDSVPRAKEGSKHDDRGLSKVPSHRYMVQRDPHQPQPLKDRAPSMKSTRSSILQTPVDQPPPQLPSPKNVSARSSPRNSPGMGPLDREVNNLRARRVTSVESSVATTNASSDQLRLEQLREGSRYSYVSVGTSRTSIAETIPTSRCSSSPPSPHKEFFAEPELQRSPPPPYRASISHSPAPNTTRRSVLAQPGPVAVETHHVSNTQNFSSNPRFSVLPEHVERPAPLRPRPAAATALPSVAPIEIPRSRPRAASRTRIPDKPLSPTMEESPIIAKNTPIRREPSLGQLPLLSARSSEGLSQIGSSQPRVKPFMRPLPVKPSEPPPSASNSSQDQPRLSEPFVPHRFSSLPSPPHPNFSNKPNAMNRLSRQPVTNFSLPSATTAYPSASTAAPKALRRPNSMQIRSDPAPFLSAARSRGYSRSSSASPAPFRAIEAQKVMAKEHLASMPEIGTSPSMSSLDASPAIRTRTLMPAMSLQTLPPPAPPPNFPLPAPPPSMAFLAPPPTMPLPTLPPNIPLPPTPSG